MFLTPRWFASHLFALTLIVAFVAAGLWQLERLDQRVEQNEQVLERIGLVNSFAAVAALDQPGGEGTELEFRRVQLQGSFDASREVLIANRSREGVSGFWLWTVFEIDGGPEMIVNRGFVERGSVLGSATSADIGQAAPTSGPVTIEGLLRAGDLDARLSEDRTQLTRPDTVLAAEVLGVTAALDPVLYLQLEAQEPPRFEMFPIPLPRPDLGQGPHLSYAFQWFTFATIGVIGYGALLRRIKRGYQERGDVPLDASYDSPVVAPS